MKYPEEKTFREEICCVCGKETPISIAYVVYKTNPPYICRDCDDNWLKYVDKLLKSLKLSVAKLSNEEWRNVFVEWIKNNQKTVFIFR
jgi:hypothetical protein